MTFSRADIPRLPLTPEEILEISRDISLNFAPARNAPKAALLSNTVSSEASIYASPISGSQLSARDLLEVSASISQQFAPKPSAVSPELLILPVDPYHLYACWDMGETLGTKQVSTQVNNNMVLRIFWWSSETAQQQRESNVWLDIPIEQTQQRKQIRLPLPGSVYTAALGEVLPDFRFDALAYSNQIRVPTIGKKEAPLLIKNDKNLWELFPPVVAPATISTFPTPGWQIKLHAATASNEADNLRLHKLSELLHRMGITVQLIPEFDQFEAAACFNYRASGQGISG